MRSISVYGNVVIKQGDEIIVEKHNDVLVNGYKWLCSMWLCASLGNVNIGSKLFNIKFGKGNDPNSKVTDSLDSSIDIDPNSKYGDGVNSSGNRYETRFVGSWNSGSLNTGLESNEKLEEVGLFLGMCNIQTTRWTSTTFAQGLFARMTLGDDAFVPNANKPVIVEWTIGVEFK